MIKTIKNLNKSIQEAIVNMPVNGNKILKDNSGKEVPFQDFIDYVRGDFLADGSINTNSNKFKFMMEYRMYANPIREYIMYNANKELGIDVKINIEGVAGRCGYYGRPTDKVYIYVQVGSPLYEFITTQKNVKSDKNDIARAFIKNLPKERLAIAMLSYLDKDFIYDSGHTKHEVDYPLINECINQVIDLYDFPIYIFQLGDRAVIEDVSKYNEYRDSRFVSKTMTKNVPINLRRIKQEREKLTLSHLKDKVENTGICIDDGIIYVNIANNMYKLIRECVYSGKTNPQYRKLISIIGTNVRLISHHNRKVISYENSEVIFRDIH